MPKVLAIDTETTGLDIVKGCKPFAVYIFDSDGTHWYWKWEVDPFTRQPIVPKRDVKEIKDMISSADELVFHNYSFDLRALDSVGIHIDIDEWGLRLHDTGVMSHVLRSDKTQLVRGKLKELAIIFLKYPKEDEKELQKITTAARRAGKKLGWNLADQVEADYWMPAQIAKEQQRPYDDIWYNVCDKYGMSDVERTLGLYFYLHHGLVAEGLIGVYQKEQLLFPVIHQMMQRGITVSMKRIRAEILERETRIEESLQKMRLVLKDNDFNPSSTRDLQVALFDKLKFTPTKMNKTGPSTDKSVVAALHSSAEKAGTSRDDRRRISFLDALAKYRKASTSRGYLKEYEHEAFNGRLYYSLKQTGTSTTRFSSSKPNAQNVGKGEDAVDEEGNTITVDSLRRVFGPMKGRLWFAMDYSQLQLRIFAYISGEKSLIEAFENGWDAHDYMAHRIFRLGDDEKPTKIQRRVAKNVNFGFIFGASPEKIEATAGMTGLWNTVIGMFPNAHGFMEKTKRQVRYDRYVTTVTGYRLYLPYRDGAIAAHAGVNYLVQGAEGSLVKKAMIKNHCYFKSLTHLFEPEDIPFITLQVHDEIIYDLPNDLDAKFEKKIVRTLKKNMELAGKELGMVTPVDVEVIRSSWDRGQDYEL